MQKYDKLEAHPAFLTAKGFHSKAKATYIVLFVCLIIGVAFATYRWVHLKDAVSSQATITKIIEIKDDYGTSYYKPEYQFEDLNGNKVTITSPYHESEASGKVGESISILYPPDDPQSAIEDNFWVKWGISTAIIMCALAPVLPLAVIDYLVVRHIRKSKVPEWANQ